MDADDQDDAAAIVKARAGDRDAFADLVLRHQGRLRAWTAQYLGSAEDVADVVQDALVDAFRNLQSYDPDRPFSPWLRAVCRNRLLRFLRDRRRACRFRRPLDEALAAAAAQDDDDGQAEARIQALTACLERLDEGQRRLLTRRYTQSVSVKDLAAELGKRPDTVSMALVRLRAALAECVRKRLGAAP